ncbi:hypothetical protein BOX15_Mlig008408g2 [Macrostomum lignano]|uniref:Uncharacterized protein n=2 Tax=Macrostomum lignano TaxID=282301 RepID=A0A267E0W5_9PLAT|nr:hypothetical protein BOX15_Mlig008408g2 [Macrostomum lignano]
MLSKKCRSSLKLRVGELESQDSFAQFANQTRRQQPNVMKSLQWFDDFGCSSSSSSSSPQVVDSPQSRADVNRSVAATDEVDPEDAVRSSSNSKQLLDDNNNSKGIDVLNLPSTAEALAKQKTWIVINFRYRMRWHQAKPFLEKHSKEDAYKPENLNYWTRYVRVSQHRKVPFLNAVRAFRNRMQCPGIQMRYTLNAFHHKGADTERNKNPGPLHPTALPVFRCPDDIPEFRKMANAVINVFVTTDDAFFDEFWKEALSKQA